MPSSQSAPSVSQHGDRCDEGVLLAADSGQVTALCLLDLTVAFDTVDHDLLMLRLERQFSIHGVALEWFRSYLQDRSFHVIYGGSTSATVHIVCSVPQGSVLMVAVYSLCTRRGPSRSCQEIRNATAYKMRAENLLKTDK